MCLACQFKALKHKKELVSQLKVVETKIRGIFKKFLIAFIVNKYKGSNVFEKDNSKQIQMTFSFDA